MHTVPSDSIAQLVEWWTLVFQKVRIRIPLKSPVFLLMLAVLENHEIFSSYFSEDDSEMKFI